MTRWGGSGRTSGDTTDAHKFPLGQTLGMVSVPGWRVVNPKPNMVRHRTTMPCPRAVTDWSTSRSPGSPPAWSPRPSRRVVELRRAARKVNHQRQEGEMDAAQPSPGAELGLPVIAHSPGRKQQAAACVTQPGEGPARLPGDGGRREGKGQRQRQDRREARSPALHQSRSEGHQPGTPRPGRPVTTGRHSHWLMMDGYCVIWADLIFRGDWGVWLSDECLPSQVALSSANLSPQHLGN